MLTGEPSEKTEGVRIAATRVGQGRDRAGGKGNGSPTKVAAGRLEQAPLAKARPVRTPAVPNGPRVPKVSAARAKVLRQRRRRRRLLITFTALTAFLTFVVGVGYAYVQHRLGQIRRLNLPARS